MIPKIEKAAINLKVMFLVLFILMTIVAAICYAGDEEEIVDRSILCFWPPDMVPHPPHFPPPPPTGPVA